jgi:hypothetical protein
MRSDAVRVRVALVLALSGHACSQGTPTTASSTANVIVVGAPAAPAGLPGYVIDTGSGGTSDVPLTCSDQVCVETIQLQNTGPGCAGNIDGSINLYLSPASPTSPLSTRAEGLLIPNNPVLAPGQVVSANVSVPPPGSLAAGYVVIAQLNWTNPTCP